MSKPQRKAKLRERNRRRSCGISVGSLLWIIAAGITPAIWIRAETARPIPGVSGSNGAATFNRDIAPIVLNHCAICHRPGQSGPFSLLTYEEVKKHARQIAEVTARRYMPPWLPEPGYGQFAGERRLSEDQIRLVQRWVAEGAIEGSPGALSPAPLWSEGWQLGKPDLVVGMPEPFTLPADGRDVYRNFVIPVPLPGRRYVKAVEFQPGNPRIVHHAFIRVDGTRQSRRLAGKDGQPGFPGMSTPDSVQMPGGHFLSWQPGKLPSPEPEGLAWALEKDSDLVVQAHLRPSGKPEPVRLKVALYFTDTPPTNTSFRLVLTSLSIDIPPGAADYKVQDEFVLPVDVQALAVLPHAHYLGKEMQGYATLPDGTTQWLIWIRNWDFNWQGDYRYASPVFLPRGSKLSMRYTFDNSTGNVRNPNNPLQRVTYGPQTTDEMAEFWLQLLPRNGADREILAAAFSAKMKTVFREYAESLLRADPDNAGGHLKLGMALLGQGRINEARDHLIAAARMDPENDQPHYYLGLALRQQRKLADARSEFEKALRLNPANYKAHGNLGLILAEQGMLDLAETHFRNALRINPDDSLARESLDELIKGKAK